MPSSRSTSSRLTASKYPRISINHGLQVRLQTRSILASKCISNVAQSRPQSASLSSLNHGLHVYIQTSSIMAFKCISKLARSWSWSASVTWLDHGLPVYIQTRSITASKFAWSGPSSSFPNLFDHQPPSASPNSPDYSAVERWSCDGIRREFVRKSSSGSSSVWRGWEDMMGYPAMRKHKYCVDLWMPGKSAWDQELWIMDCVFRIMRWCVYTPHCSVHLRYPWISIPPLRCSICLCFPFILVCPLRFPPAKLNGGGGNAIFSPQWPPSAALSSLIRHLQVLLRLHSSTVCSQIDCMFIYRETWIDNTCHIVL